MHVHVHARGLDLHEEHPHRLPARGERRREAAVHGEVEHPVTHVPAVHKDVERPRRREAELGRGDHAVDAQAEPPLLEGKEERRHLGAERGGDALADVAGARRENLDGAAFVLEPEGDLGVSERQAQHRILHVLQLGLRAPEELPAGRHPAEQVLHPDLGARACRGRGEPRLSVLEADLGALGRPVQGGAQHQPGHRGDGRQRLAPEPEGPDGEEVLRGAELARGVAPDTEHSVVAGHPRAVVRHLDEAGPPALDDHSDGAGAGVERVLAQFLDHRGGALDDLAGGDLVDERVAEEGDGRQRPLRYTERPPTRNQSLRARKDEPRSTGLPRSRRTRSPRRSSRSYPRRSRRRTRTPGRSRTSSGP